MKEENPNRSSKNLEMAPQELEEHPSHKPFMAKVPIKHTPVGQDFHQAVVPDFDPSKVPGFTQEGFSSKMLFEFLEFEQTKDTLANLSPAVFLSSRINEKELLQYLSFVQAYFQEKIPDYFNQNSVSRERTRCKALNLLHQCDYNYTKAKFFVLFPYYRTYNSFRCHEPLNLSDDQMSRKIHAHVDNLKNSKQNDLMTWVKTIQNQIESRIHISKFTSYLDLAKQSKFDIPDSIRDMADKAVRIGKDLKKSVLNNKNTLADLEKTKKSLLDQKIITNQMTHFEEAVVRAEEWIKKQEKFRQEYYFEEEVDGQDKLVIKSMAFFQKNGKIEYKALHNLVYEYNSLPLSYPPFNQTFVALYEETNKLISKIPNLTKMAKTRKCDGVVKLPRKLITELLYLIRTSPVDHEDFITFQLSITDGLEQLERIGMYLEDIRQEKNLKNLMGYVKILADIPIQNQVQKKLTQKIEYYQLIDRIRKDISNPQKYDSLKEQLGNLRSKGYQSEEHFKLQQRVMTCMGWHQSFKLIKEDKKVPNIFFILNQSTKIKKNMIHYDNFQIQLESAKNQLNLPEDVLKESSDRLAKAQALKSKIKHMMMTQAQFQTQMQEQTQDEPSLSQLIETFKECYQNGISFSEFEAFYKNLQETIILLAKLHYLLLTSDEITAEESSKFFLKVQQCQKIIETCCDCKKNELKEIRTKQTGDKLLQTVLNSRFPKKMIQWELFQEFMRKAQQWSDRALSIIQQSKVNDNIADLRQVIEQSKYCLHSKMIEEELNKIQIVLKWRQKITKKMNPIEPEMFNDPSEKQFIKKLQQTLQQEQRQQDLSQQQTKSRVLQFLHENGVIINTMLEKIASSSSDNLITVKLSEMNKFIKQVDRQIERYQLKDKVIDQLKEQMQIQLLINEDWKERYFAIKRFEKKKMGQPHIIAAKEAYYQNIGYSIAPKQHSSQLSVPRKKSQFQDDHLGENNEISFDLMKDQKEEKSEQHSHYLMKSQPMPYIAMILQRPSNFSEHQQQPKKKYFIRNGDFCVYYRMLLMLLEFYNASRLKFVVEEFSKLKQTLTQVYKVIEKYNIIYKKNGRTDADFQLLQAETVKVSVFFKQSHLITNKHAQIVAWKCMAEHVLRSVPVINMQIRARKVEELKQLIEEQQERANNQQKMAADQRVQQISSKRRRRPNQYYDNDDITLLKDQFLPKKGKRRKTNNSVGGVGGNTNSVNSISGQNQNLNYSNINNNNNDSTQYYQPQNRQYSGAPRQWTLGSASNHHSSYYQQSNSSNNNNSKQRYPITASSHPSTANPNQKQIKEQAQRIKAFLNGQYNPQTIINDPKQYCICRNGEPNENSWMVQCQDCKEWFHIECLGLKKHQVKNDDIYECIACKSLKYEFGGGKHQGQMNQMGQKDKEKERGRGREKQQRDRAAVRTGLTVVGKRRRKAAENHSQVSYSSALMLREQPQPQASQQPQPQAQQPQQPQQSPQPSHQQSPSSSASTSSPLLQISPANYPPVLGYFWDHHQRMTEYALVQLFEQGKKLNVNTTQLTKLQIVHSSMQKWKQQTKSLLEKLVRQNPMDLTEYESQIYPLYLQSMWLPTAHYEAVHLKRLMKEIYRINNGLGS